MSAFPPRKIMRITPNVVRLRAERQNMLAPCFVSSLMSSHSVCCHFGLRCMLSITNATSSRGGTCIHSRRPDDAFVVQACLPAGTAGGCSDSTSGGSSGEVSSQLMFRSQQEGGGRELSKGCCCNWSAPIATSPESAVAASATAGALEASADAPAPLHT